MATLVITEGPANGSQFALEDHALVMIGRDHDCTFQILDTQISRRHCQLRYEPKEDRHYAIDFKSHNGVNVNGEKIADPYPLEDGDVIQIGGSHIVYSMKDLPDAQHISQIMRKHGEGHLRTQTEN